MDVSKIIKGIVNSRGYTITSAITQWDYGYVFVPEFENMPATYRLDFSNDERHGTALPVYCGSEGGEVPEELIDTGKDIFVWFFYIGDGFGKSEYKWRIPNHCRPSRDGQTPAPSQQSSIDQLIVRSNEAVTSAEQSASAAGQSAQNASQDADRAEQAKTDAETAQRKAEEAQESAERAKDDADTSERNASESERKAKGYAETASAKADSIHSMTASAQTLPAGSSATASYDAETGVMSFGIPKGKDGRNGTDGDDGYSPTANVSKSGKVATITITDKNGTTSAQVRDGEDGATGATPNLTIGTVETLEPTDDATATITGTAENPVLNLGIPRGESGETIDTAPIITDTASGSIASFSDGADDLPLKSLVVDINPVQDLHGQDAPYPAGGGKNKFLFSDENRTATSYGVTCTFDRATETFTVTGTETRGSAFSLLTNFDLADFHIPNFVAGETYTVSVVPTSGSNNNYVYCQISYRTTAATNAALFTTWSDKTTFTVPSNFDYVYNVFIGIYAGATDLNYSFKVQIESGSTATSWSPYENLCPISGWTQVDVNHSGVNVWDEEWEVGGIRTADGTNVNVAGCIRSKDFNPIIGGASYYIKSVTGNAGIVYIFFYDENKDYIGYNSKNNTVVVAPDNARFFKIQPTSVYGDVYNHDISINYPSTDHSYHPYTGRSITISLGQTVYGGHLDVLSGELTVYPYYASYNGETLTGEWISDRDKYVAGTTPTIGAQVVNIEAQGLTVQLESHEVASLYGVNNLWADSGDTEVVYRADTKLFIERLTAPDSADMIADANITSGKYFMVGNSLYKATANIANGSAIIVGTNCTRKSLSEALNEINA